MWTLGDDADVSVWDVSSSGHPGHLRFLILCFRVCWDGERRLEVHLRTYLWHWYTVEHQHEAPVHLQMVEPAGAAAVLFGAGAGIWRSRGKTWKKKKKITPIGGNCEHLFNNSTTRLNLLLRLVLTQYWVTPFTNWPKTDFRSNEDTFEASDNSFNQIVNIVFLFFFNFIGCLDFLSTFSFRSQTSAALVCCTAAVSLMPVNNCCYGDNAIRKPWYDPSIATTHACMVKRAHRE